jgi:hypothetical protein
MRYFPTRGARLRYCLAAPSPISAGLSRVPLRLSGLGIVLGMLAAFGNVIYAACAVAWYVVYWLGTIVYRSFASRTVHSR